MPTVANGTAVPMWGETAADVPAWGEAAKVLEEAAPSWEGELSGPDGSEEPKSRRRRLGGYALLVALAAAWMADQLLLTSMQGEIVSRFQVPPSQLYILFVFKGLSLALSALPAGYLAQWQPRPVLICAGCTVWSAGLLGCAAATGFPFFCACRVASAFGLGLVHPMLLSLLLDSVPQTRRGLALGVLQVAAVAGEAAGRALATSLAPTVFAAFNMWEGAFALLATLMAGLGLLIARHVHDPTFATAPAHRPANPLAKLREVVRCRTFLLLELQSALTRGPLLDFLWGSLWVQMLRYGFKDTYSCFSIGQATAGLLVGHLTDLFAYSHPRQGPLPVATLITALGIPLVIYAAHSASTIQYDTHGLVARLNLAWVSLGVLLSTWGVVKDRVLADVVPVADLTYQYGAALAIDSALEAAVMPMIKHAQVWLGFGSAGADSLLIVGAGTWLVGMTCFAAMHATYPTDRRLSLYEETYAVGPL